MRLTITKLLRTTAGYDDLAFCGGRWTGVDVPHGEALGGDRIGRSEGKDSCVVETYPGRLASDVLGNDTVYGSISSFRGGNRQTFGCTLVNREHVAARPGAGSDPTTGTCKSCWPSRRSTHVIHVAGYSTDVMSME